MDGRNQFCCFFFTSKFRNLASWFIKFNYKNDSSIGSISMDKILLKNSESSELFVDSNYSPNSGLVICSTVDCVNLFLSLLSVHKTS